LGVFYKLLHLFIEDEIVSILIPRKTVAMNTYFIILKRNESRRDMYFMAIITAIFPMGEYIINT
jgi:hypothetical protein